MAGHNPMSRDRLADLERQASLMRSGMIPSSVQSVGRLIDELIADRAWHRTRVPVTDEDVAGVGLEFLCGSPRDCRSTAKALAWVEGQPSLRHSAAVGIYHIEVSEGRLVRERLILSAEDEMHADSWRGVTGRRWVSFDAGAINVLAKAVGRAPLDVLDEIAGMPTDPRA